MNKLEYMAKWAKWVKYILIGTACTAIALVGIQFGGKEYSQYGWLFVIPASIFFVTGMAIVIKFIMMPNKRKY